MQIHLFGASTAVGLSFSDLLLRDDDFILYKYSRSSSLLDEGYRFLDFRSPQEFAHSLSPDCRHIFVSFAPIWLFAPFLRYIATECSGCLAGLSGVIACSSSSVITKRFAFSSYDRQLVSKLSNAEQGLIGVCHELSVPCSILRPSMIYGRVGSSVDRNLSGLLSLMRTFPLLPVPSQSGLRQPIHANQLAAVALHLAGQLVSTSANPSFSDCIALGGDCTLTYFQMLLALRQSQPSGDPAHNCRLIEIPSRLFYFLASPLLLRSLHAYEAVLRIGANLAGFTAAHKILGCEAQPFPAFPIA